MKKALLSFIVLGTVVVSCGPNKADYDVAAKDLCDCSNNLKEYQELIDLGIMTEQGARETQYAVCIKNAEDNKGIDFKSDLMMESIKEKCADLESAHKTYVESASGDTTVTN